MKLLGAAFFLASLASPATSQQVISVHGSGTTNPSKCYWQIMDQMHVMSKQPIRMTYRGVGSSTGQAEFIGNGTLSDNMFGSGDIPFSTEDYSLFPEGSIFHLPIVLGSIGFFHSVPTGDEQLKISPCVLAKIFNRKITDWTDPEIANDNPNLDLPNPSPITVARRVLGSSSTSGITAYLNQVCPEEWPEEWVGSTIEWPTDTIACDGSGAMTDCITGTAGTIGYLESGHGHSEGLEEIELLNSAQNFLTSKEAAEKGGILSAMENAVFPDSLQGDFGNVNLLNQAGANTWPVVAMSYIYVKKDLTFIGDPAAQTLLQTFLKALYAPEWITQCEEEFGFVRVDGVLRDKALEAIDSMIVSTDAPQWTFEYETEKNIGQGDFVISTKRSSYSEVEQDNLVEKIAALTEQLVTLQSEYEKVMAATHSDQESNQDTEIQAALVMSSISIALWILALIGLVVRCATGSHSPSNGSVETSKAGQSDDVA